MCKNLSEWSVRVRERGVRGKNAGQGFRILCWWFYKEGGKQKFLNYKRGKEFLPPKVSSICFKIVCSNLTVFSFWSSECTKGCCHLQKWNSVCTSLNNTSNVRIFAHLSGRSVDQISINLVCSYLIELYRERKI